MMNQEIIFKICVDEATSSTLAGRMYSVLEEAPFEFHDFQQLLLYMDQLLDKAGRPQSSYKKRSFIKEPENYGYRYTPIKVQSYDNFKDIEGVLGTFFINVISRYNAVWQGVCILSDQQCYEFNSDLELLHIFEKIANVYLCTCK